MLFHCCRSTPASDPQELEAQIEERLADAMEGIEAKAVESKRFKVAMKHMEVKRTSRVDWWMPRRIRFFPALFGKGRNITRAYSPGGTTQLRVGTETCRFPVLDLG